MVTADHSHTFIISGYPISGNPILGLAVDVVGPVMLAGYGKHYTTLSYARAVQRACDRAFPVPEENKADSDAVRHWQKAHRWAPNQLRHALGTRVRREFDLEAAKTLLGHSQINTTGIYAEQDRRRALEVAKRIG